jgi:hypothetical protein
MKRYRYILIASVVAAALEKYARMRRRNGTSASNDR